MLKVLCSGDSAKTVYIYIFFNPFLLDEHILQRLHGMAARRKATIAHYSRKRLMKVLIKYVFNYS